MKKALKKGKVMDCKSSSSSMDKKQRKEQKKEAKKESKEKKVQEKQSKMKQKLLSRLDKKMGSSSKVSTSLENLMAKEYAKIAELHRRIREVEQKRNAKQQEIYELKKKECKDRKPEVKKVTKSLRSKERKLKKLKNEVETVEDKIKQLTGEHSTPAAIKESGQAKTDNRAVSDTNTAIASGAPGPSRITVTPGPRVINVRPLPTQSEPLLPPRPSTAVRRFLLPPDTTTITPRERMVREMLKVEQRAQEELLQRPRAAHPFRIRSLTENVQEFLPYDLEHFDSDSDDEEPMRVNEDVGAQGMRRFQQQQNTSSQISTEKNWRVRWTTVVDTDSEDDDFEFLQLEMTIGDDTPTRPPTRCTNAMAKQMLQEEETEGVH